MGAEHDVHPRRPPGDLAAVLLRQAPADGDLHARRRVLDRLELAQVAVQPVVGVLPHGTGVEHHDVSGVAVARARVAGVLQQPGKALGVVNVHLAPEGADLVRTHDGSRVRAGCRAPDRRRPGRGTSSRPGRRLGQVAAVREAGGSGDERGAPRAGQGCLGRAVPRPGQPLDRVGQLRDRQRVRQPQERLQPAVDAEHPPGGEQQSFLLGCRHDRAAAGFRQLAPEAEPARGHLEPPLRQAVPHGLHHHVAGLAQHREPRRQDRVQLLQQPQQHQLLEHRRAEVERQPRVRELLHRIPRRPDPAEAQSAPQQLADAADRHHVGRVRGEGRGCDRAVERELGDGLVDDRERAGAAQRGADLLTHRVRHEEPGGVVEVRHEVGRPRRALPQCRVDGLGIPAVGLIGSPIARSPERRAAAIAFGYVGDSISSRSPGPRWARTTTASAASVPLVTITWSALVASPRAVNRVAIASRSAGSPFGSYPVPARCRGSSATASSYAWAVPGAAPGAAHVRSNTPACAPEGASTCPAPPRPPGTAAMLPEPRRDTR